MNNNKRIALTVDDLPYKSLSVNDKSKEGLEITTLLLRHLKQNDVKATGFVIGGKIGEEEKRLDLLGKWQSDGHLLANHTYSHLRFSNISSDDFEKEVIKSEKILAPYWGKKTVKYFRFPYLDCGSTIEKISKALDFLYKRSYIIAPVTIDSGDYHFNRIYTDACLNNDVEMMQHVIDWYLEYTKEIVEFRERQAMYFLNRPIGHIMLMHANRINAYSLDRVIALFKRKGYEFVSLSEILNEPDSWENYAKINSPEYMSWQVHSNNGKSERICYPQITSEILEVFKLRTDIAVP